MIVKTEVAQVRYQGSDGYLCTYCVTDDGRQYYFLGANDEKKFKNGNRIVSTALIEVIDPMARASNIGVIDEDGNEVIPCVNKSIRPINDAVILVEVAEPVSQSVIDAVNSKSDPLSATKLVSTPALIKEKLNARMGFDGRYVFNDQFSEATVCDIDGNNLVDGEYYSFIGMADSKLYLSKNYPDSEIDEYSMLPPEIQNSTEESATVDVTNVDVPSDTIENALNSYESEVAPEEVSTESVQESVDSMDVDIPTVTEDEHQEELDQGEASSENEDSGTLVDDLETALGDESSEAITTEPTTEAITALGTDTDLDSVSEESLDIEPESSVTPEPEAEEPTQETEAPQEEVAFNIFDSNPEEETSTDELESNDFDFTSSYDPDVFKSQLVPDTFEPVNDDLTSYYESDLSDGNDVRMTDVAKSFKNLIELCGRQKRELKKSSEKISLQEQKITALNSKIRAAESAVRNLKDENRSLRDTNSDLRHDLAVTRQQLKGSPDFAELISAANDILDDSNSYDSGIRHYGKVA